MKINSKYIFIPPYISTSWAFVTAIRSIGDDLFISLNNGETVTVPKLSHDDMVQVFNSHAQFLEKNTSIPPTSSGFSQAVRQFLNDDPSQSMKINLGPLSELGEISRHNPEQSNGPELPSEILNKIREITHIIGPPDSELLPLPIQDCLCFFCQISRAIHFSASNKLPIYEELQMEKVEEIHFENWEVKEAGQNLFNVVSKLDNHEHYTVFLGSPIGCTCGKENCEHIVAVLRS